MTDAVITRVWVRQPPDARPRWKEGLVALVTADSLYLAGGMRLPRDDLQRNGWTNRDGEEYLTDAARAAIGEPPEPVSTEALVAFASANETLERLLTDTMDFGLTPALKRYDPDGRLSLAYATIAAARLLAGFATHSPLMELANGAMASAKLKLVKVGDDA